MKFNRCPWSKDTRVIMTPRRIAAARRRLAKERDKVALLPDMAAEVPSLDKEIAAIEAAAPAAAAEWREHWARNWRKGRRELAQLPEHSRRGLVRYWNSWSGPKTPEYFLTFVAQASAGRSFWTQLRELRQFFLIGQRRFPVDRIEYVFARGRNVGFRPYRGPEFYSRRRHAKRARKQNVEGAERSVAQLWL